MLYEVITLDGYTLNSGDLYWEDLKNFGEVIVYDRTDKSEVIERINDAEIVITNKVIIDRTVFENCKNLKYVGVTATGYNVVDTDSASEYGIIVTNVPASYNFV